MPGNSEVVYQPRERSQIMADVNKSQLTAGGVLAVITERTSVCRATTKIT